MPIPVVCPSCSAKTKAPERFAGGFMSCPKCEEPIPVPEADRDAITERAPSKPKKGAIARPKRDDDDDLPTPPDVAHKGIKVLIAGGIVGVVALVLATIVLLKGMWKEKPADPAPPPVAAATPQPKKDEPPPEKKLVYQDWTKGPLRIGDTEVRLSQVRWGKVMVEDLATANVVAPVKPSDKNYLVVGVEIRNLSPTVRLVYGGWSHPDGLAGLEMLGQALSGQAATPSPATLKDEQGGDALAQVKFGTTEKVKDQKGRTPLLPKQSLADILVFEEPAAGGGALLLDLPLKALGGSDAFRFRIPKTSVGHDKR